MTALGSNDAMVAALHELLAAVDRIDENNELIRTRARRLLERRSGGDAWREIIATEGPPVIIELLNDNLRLHNDAGGPLRRAEAAALHAEGMTMDQIAALFGITRQRVSQLLRG